jgi:hypothetical protein
MPYQSFVFRYENLVFQKACRQAENASNRLDQGKLSFPKRKKKGFLSVEVNGAAREPGLDTPAS